MRSIATITVTSGPDRGKVFECGDDVLHIGRGAENQVVLSDAELQEHQASLVRREGRYAIYTPLREAVDVDGNTIPPDQWVWLPTGGRVKLGRRTVLEISLGDAGSPAAGSARPAQLSPAEVDTPPDECTPVSRSGKRNGARRSGVTGKPKRVVAKFVTDAQGISRVQLGEDGQFPELSLAEAAERTPGERKQLRKTEATGASALLYLVLGASMLASVMLLLVDAQPDRDETISREQALRSLVDYYGDAESPPEPYQELLREAGLARSRDDVAAANRAYRRVLGWLRAEDNSRGKPLTGSRTRDRELRELLTIVVAE